ncbi:autotransporter outer membrane beta-barrel domain-containing protein [Stenotrophomonas sp. SY1]|uniref:autotransporter outer membrane beta-barrel domain-containing protein n=1 Tax=Stenotrophomonas sp. SY1 TaxID=477235 RepID=UPI001E29B001|nr:autotransporter outer membrane beta-barrel domain-containing protein [Stenotrophomonas sp. SY1]MCD9085704.1 autotransporter outer membrane beta-barrel domain-containing protein [Stenotrophomonas sp. SY1]
MRIDEAASATSKKVGNRIGFDCASRPDLSWWPDTSAALIGLSVLFAANMAEAQVTTCSGQTAGCRIDQALFGNSPATAPIGNDTAGGLTIGYSSNGVLGIQGGTTVVSSFSFNGIGNTIGDLTTGTGTVTVSGLNSAWNSSGNALIVGNSGTGTLNIQSGAQVVSTGGGIVGNSATGSGTVTMDGPGSLWRTNTASITIGSAGRGTLAVLNGASVSTNFLDIGGSANGSGAVTVNGSASVVQTTGMRVGTAGTGTLAIENGGTVNNNGNVFIGNGASGSGVATLSGAQTNWNNSGGIYVGLFGTGALTVADGATASGSSINVAARTGSKGTVNIGAAAGAAAAAPGTLAASSVEFGPGAGLLVFNHSAADHTFVPAINGPGAVSVLSGTTIFAADKAYTGGTTISGGTLQLGSGGASGSVVGNITDNGTLAFNRGDVYTFGGVISGTGVVNQLGAGTTILTADNTYTGNTTIASGTLQLGNGGASGAVVSDVANDGALAFNRSDSHTMAGLISGTGTVNQIGTGTTVLTAGNTYSGGTTISAGTLQLGNGGAAGWIVGDVTDNGALAFNRSDVQTFAGTISGTGTVSQIGAGTTVMTGANSYAGATTVAAGGLYIDGNQSGATAATSVAAGATLGGSGTIGGSVTVADGATLSPGSLSNAPGTLAINGDLSLNGGSLLAYSLGEANAVGGAFNDLVTVGGDLVLDGVLNVVTTPGGSFDTGIYRLISYAGALTNSGLAIGTIPSPDYYVQTSVANQVNLINTSGLTLNYWDGAAGPKNDGIVNGGVGVWQTSAGNDNWTNAVGTPNAPFSDRAFAIFTGLSANVSVDNSLGPVTASGMQFAVDGYVVGGDVLTLVDDSSAPGISVIRVGDGTAASAGYTATINAVLTGSSQLVKVDGGTLVLTAANTYSGGTLIRDGGISIANDANLGTSAGSIVFEGGTLLTTEDLSSARVTTVGTGGGTIDTAAATNFVHSGAISGPGMLTKNGGGRLTLLADTTYSGGTVIGDGTLQLGNGGTSGALVGDVTNNGLLVFNRSNMIGFAGAISGTGGVDQIGTGTTVLSSTANSYSGDTRVNAGVLQAGAAATFSPNTAVTVAAAARLDLNGFSQTVAGVTNAGRIIFGAGAAPGTTLTTRDYAGLGGTLEINTFLGGDGSPSDRLVIDGGAASGSTIIVASNAGGLGDVTTGNGILVVDAVNGGVTSGTAFALRAPVVAGPYEYGLRRGSVDASSAESWYLRSTLDCGAAGAPSPPCPSPPDPPVPPPDPPAYRQEVSLAAALPTMAAIYARAVVDTLHERVGDEHLLSQRGVSSPDAGLGGAWVRALHHDGERDGGNQGIYGSRGPGFDYAFDVLQLGVDLYRSINQDGSHRHAGGYLAYGKARGRVRHNLLDYDFHAGTDEFDARTVGAYWTAFSPRGAYVDTVAQYTWYDMRARSTRLPDTFTNGTGVLASVEVGWPWMMGVERSGDKPEAGWRLEPQAQVIWQKTALDDLVDETARVRYSDGDASVGRLGVRLSRLGQRASDSGDRATSWWIRGNAWHDFSGSPTTEFSSASGYVPFTADLGDSWGEIGLGGTWQVSAGGYLFADADYTWSFDGEESSWNGKLGMRWQW